MEISSLELLLIFAGMMVVTYLPRALPLTILSKVNLPDFFLKVLQYIPVAILGALLLPSILIQDGSLNISLSNHSLIAAVITCIVAFSFKKLFITIVTGVLSMFLLNYFF